MKRTRSERRHFAQVAIKKAIRTIKLMQINNEPIDPSYLQHMVSTHCRPCSCPMCGNPRRYFKRHTLKEVKAKADFEKQFTEMVSDDNTGSTESI